MTDSVNRQNLSADYWSANNPNALNEYDDGSNPVWINREPKTAIHAENRTVRVYKNPNHCVSCWTLTDGYNWV